MTANCLLLDSPTSSKQIDILRSNGTLLSLSGQRKRIYEAESLLEFLSGYPEASHNLGEYLANNGYSKFMDFIEDSSVNSEIKALSFATWENTLKSRKDLNELPFIE